MDKVGGTRYEIIKHSDGPARSTRKYSGSQEEGCRRVCCKGLWLALAAWNPRIAGTPGMYSFEQLLTFRLDCGS
jgi:hypothetical protein